VPKTTETTPIASTKYFTVYDFPLPLLRAFGCKCATPTPVMAADILRDIHKCECGSFYTPAYLEERNYPLDYINKRKMK
jgi:hypothetical protein